MTQSTCTSDFQLTSTLLVVNSPDIWRVDATDQTPSQHDFVPLRYHHQRLLASAEAFQWYAVCYSLRSPSSLGDFIEAIKQHVDSKWPESHYSSIRIRVCLSAEARMTIESQDLTQSSQAAKRNKFSLPENPMPDPTGVTSVVFTSPQTLEPSDFTRYKTTMRDHYDRIRKAAGISDLPPTKAEVLICNNAHEVTEASLSTVYFVRAGLFITPHSDCGGNQGVSRRIALHDNRCSEGIVTREELVEGEVIWLSNAVRGFWPARLTLKDKA